MADTDTTEQKPAMGAPPPAPAVAPPPPPSSHPKPAPEISVAEKARQEVAKGKTGFDPLRPFRYGKAFILGTITDGLNGAAKWGQRGLKWGGIAGFVAWMAPATAAYFGSNLVLGGVLAIASGGTIPALIAGMALCAGIGIAAGVVLGGIHGLATGGARAMGREIRRDRYAEDLVQREAVRQHAAQPGKADYRVARRVHRQRQADDTLWTMERLKEVERDSSKTYWQDREQSGASSGYGVGRF